MEKIYICETDVLEEQGKITKMEETMEMENVSITNYSRKVRLGLCRENRELLINTEYNGISIMQEEDHMCIRCVKHIYDDFHERLSLNRSEYQEALWRWKGLERMRFREERNFILNTYGQIEPLDNYEIYEAEEFAPYLPNEWAKMPEFVTKGRWDTVTDYTAEEINSEVKASHATCKLMFCQNILRISWMCAEQRFENLKRMYSGFWEIDATADFISDRSGSDWQEQFFNRMISTMRYAVQHWSVDNLEFVKWKEEVLRRVFLLLCEGEKSSVILEAIRPCLHTQEYSLLKGWYDGKEKKWIESPENIETIIGMEVRHFNTDGCCDSKRSDLVQSLFVPCWEGIH